ncbi:MAG: tRNA (adenosine(37)-N6)-threonylcarbamoyltransferase complex dimerization subunit type 1 TsaB [Gammaproteobacteria bacterium]|nr:tRNA (adenosine(37)-N6)-threonylcarbamoyltransferase complex dimerization subunit type 1 TsaB [Gammaproteobacteria bacterium]
MKLLAIDTSTDACSAALLVDDRCRCRHALAPRRHAELILPMVDELLAESGLRLRDLDALAFGCGPGTFTGVRIATGVVQGLALAANLPVAPVSTLAAMAHAACTEHGAGAVLAALDARMDELYLGTYVYHTALEAARGDQLGSGEALQLPVRGTWYGAGPGWATPAGARLQARLGERLTQIDAQQWPHARDVARLGAVMASRGETVDAGAALPVYLRDDVATTA